MGSRRTRCKSIRVSLLAAAILLGCLPLYAQETAALDAAAALEQTLTAAIAKAEKSVVAIARVRRSQPGEIAGEPRPDAFGRRTAPLDPPQPTDPDFIANDYSAGVVVGPGLILTAAHVLGEESDYYVTAADHRVLKAAVRAADPRSDLAVLSVNANDLPPIAMGNADELRKGQIAIALGNPYGIARDGQASATWGIIANLQRKAPARPTESDPNGRPTLHHYGTLIQTDAKLNWGTSGGPLLNLRGEMIGLCVALPIAGGYDAAGGYAMPVDVAFRRALETLKLGREVEYGFLGVQPQHLSEQEVLAGGRGTRVGEVKRHSAAARHGLRVGDLITAVDGTPIYDADGLILNVGKLSADATTRLTLVRDGRRQTVDVGLTKFAVLGRKTVTAKAPGWRGMRVEYLTAVVDDNGRMVGNDLKDSAAVVVVEVLESSPAWKAGLRAGMLVTHVDHQPVATPKEFAKAAAQNSGAVQLQIADDAKNPIRTIEPGT